MWTNIWPNVIPEKHILIENIVILQQNKNPEELSIIHFSLIERLPQCINNIYRLFYSSEFCLQNCEFQRATFITSIEQTIEKKQLEPRKKIGLN